MSTLPPPDVHRVAVTVISADGDLPTDPDRGMERRLEMAIQAAAARGVTCRLPVAAVHAPELRRPLTSVAVSRARAAGSPTILITRRDPENLVALASMVVDAVVFEDATDSDLESAIARVSGDISVREALGAAAAPYAADCVVARAVSILASANPVPATIAGAARAVGVSPKAMAARWRRHSVSRCCNVKEFISALRLLHYAGMRAAGVSDQEAIVLLAISRATLYRRARQIFASTPAAIIENGSARSWLRRITRAAGWRV